MGEHKDRTGKTRVGKFLQSLGSKAVPLAKIALGVASDITGIEQLDDLANKINTSGTMTQQEKDYALMMIREERETLALEIKDRDSARQREVGIAKTGKSDWMMKLTGAMILSTFVFSLIVIYFFDVKNENMAHLMVGEILGFVSGLVFYYFGTSKQSEPKHFKRPLT